MIATITEEVNGILIGKMMTEGEIIENMFLMRPAVLIVILIAELVKIFFKFREEEILLLRSLSTLHRLDKVDKYSLGICHSQLLKINFLKRFVNSARYWKLGFLQIMSLKYLEAKVQSYFRRENKQRKLLE